MKDLRTLSHVPRWSVLRVIQRQTVADHSYYVSVYAGMLGATEKLGNDEAVSLLLNALWHDVPEVFTGDIPGPVKRAVVNADFMQSYEVRGMLDRFNLTKKEISPKVRLLLKFADLLDEVCYLTSEERIGNKEAERALEVSQARLFNLIIQSKDSLTQDTVDLIHKIRCSENNDINLPT